jgi:hypothetical protein
MIGFAGILSVPPPDCRHSPFFSSMSMAFPEMIAGVSAVPIAGQEPITASTLNDARVRTGQVFLPGASRNRIKSPKSIDYIISNTK